MLKWTCAPGMLTVNNLVLRYQIAHKSLYAVVLLLMKIYWCSKTKKKNLPECHLLKTVMILEVHLLLWSSCESTLRRVLLTHGTYNMQERTIIVRQHRGVVMNVNTLLLSGCIFGLTLCACNYMGCCVMLAFTFSVNAWLYHVCVWKSETESENYTNTFILPSLKPISASLASFPASLELIQCLLLPARLFSLHTLLYLHGLHKSSSEMCVWIDRLHNVDLT